SSMTSINFINSAANIAVLDISGADLTGLTTLKEAFSGKTSLQSVDFSRVHLAEGCSSAEKMFYNCQNLITIKMNKFKISGSLNSMFENCYSVEQLELQDFDTSEVTSMTKMFFRFCVRWNSGSGIASDKWLVVNLRDFNFKNVSSFNSFMGIDEYKNGDCHITKVILPDKKEWCDASKATDLYYMFRCCENLTEVENLGLFKAKPTGSCCAIFSRVAMEEIDVSSIDFTSSNNITWMFDANKKLKKVIFSVENQGLTLPANCFDGCGPVIREYV
nr:BspA family leucine-rich repeat surface protein [Saccharofermentans sp.]